MCPSTWIVARPGLAGGFSGVAIVARERREGLRRVPHDGLGVLAEPLRGIGHDDSPGDGRAAGAEDIKGPGKALAKGPGERSITLDAAAVECRAHTPTIPPAPAPRPSPGGEAMGEDLVGAEAPGGLELLDRSEGQAPRALKVVFSSLCIWLCHISHALLPK